MLRVVSETELRVMQRNLARVQHLLQDPRVLDAFGVSSAFQLTRVVDAEIKAVKAAKESDDDDDTCVSGPECG